MKMKTKKLSNPRKQRGKEKEQVVFPVPESKLHLPEGYAGFIKDIKERILKGRLETVITANSAMILLYWEIGNAILQRQKNAGWGAKVIDRMSYDLKTEFPNMAGFSSRNLKYMRKFAEAWPNIEIVQRTVALIPWRSNITLLDKLTDPKLRLWYAQKTIENGFGKDMLAFQIETQLHKRQGSAVNNFAVSLPPTKSDLTAQIFKDPYIFDFLGTYMDAEIESLEQKLDKYAMIKQGMMQQLLTGRVRLI